MSVMDFFSATTRTIKQHAPIALIILGILSLVGHAAFVLHSNIPTWAQLIDNALANVGTAILGAGVLGAIINSQQFSEIFQRRLATVVYRPAEAIDIERLKILWENLTESIYSQSLPRFSRHATIHLKKYYLEQDLWYHLEDFNVKHDISVYEEKRELAITHVASAKIVVAPAYEDEAELTQEISSDGKIELDGLWINKTKIDPKEYCHWIEKTTGQIRIKLKEWINERDNDGHGVLRMERRYILYQSLDREPYHFGTTKRFVKGFTVQAHINEPYSLYIKATGLRDTLTMEEIAPHTSADGYSTWQIGAPQELVLPGHGYALIILPPGPAEDPDPGQESCFESAAEPERGSESAG